MPDITPADLQAARQAGRREVLEAMRQAGPMPWRRDPEAHAVERLILDVEEQFGELRHES